MPRGPKGEKRPAFDKTPGRQIGHAPRGLFVARRESGVGVHVICSPRISRRQTWMDRRNEGSGPGAPAENVGPQVGWDER